MWNIRSRILADRQRALDGNGIIVPDADSAPLIRRLFEWYATSLLSLKEAA